MKVYAALITHYDVKGKQIGFPRLFVFKYKADMWNFADRYVEKYDVLDKATTMTGVKVTTRDGEHIFVECDIKKVLE